MIVDTEREPSPRPRRCAAERRRNLVIKVERKSEIVKERRAERRGEEEEEGEERGGEHCALWASVISRGYPARYGERVARHTKPRRRRIFSQRTWSAMPRIVRETDEWTEATGGRAKKKRIKRALLTEVTHCGCRPAVSARHGRNREIGHARERALPRSHCGFRLGGVPERRRRRNRDRGRGDDRYRPKIKYGAPCREARREGEEGGITAARRLLTRGRRTNSLTVDAGICGGTAQRRRNRGTRAVPTRLAAPS